ncbi:MAG: GntR family transcriptional regulator [Chloroflexi bacterium]|nr:MAG: GntR family transcriptional regulator [Chloroflexota bacterium]
MAKQHLYHQIAESIRQDILSQSLRSGDRLPPVRELAERWNCTVGTIQRAYELLAAEGVVTSRPGQGTHVADVSPLAQSEPLRRAQLVHRAESFLLDVLTAGYTEAEVEHALRLALDRWRAAGQATGWPAQTLRFVGSHDPAIALITSHFAGVAPNYTLQLSFVGSVGGLTALAQNQADLAGTHLWDAASGTYNVAAVKQLLPGKKVALLTLAHRRLGLAVLPGNPRGVAGLADLATPGLQFVNRQPGAGTRVWLDAQLERLGIAPDSIAGYTTEAATHTEAARNIAEQQADAALIIESAALSYGLDFIPLATERYDLAIPAEVWPRPPVQSLARWLGTRAAQQAIAALGGYDVTETGRIRWIEQ